VNWAIYFTIKKAPQKVMRCNVGILLYI